MMPRCCPIVELRQYTLKPGTRDVLIDVFDRWFVESQEALGMTVIGQFRDRRRSDRFVWLRGFADMDARHRALEAFYDGPVWAAHKDAANDTMLEFDDVLLLRPARPDLALVMPGDDAQDRSSRGAARTVLAGIYRMPHTADDAVVGEFERDVAPALGTSGLHLSGVFVTEYARNTFTRLPVREGEHVLVWLGTLDEGQRPVDQIERAATHRLRNQPVSVLVLDPTSRSLLGGGADAARREQP